MYWVGALRNIEQVSKYFPGWICRFYIDNSCDKELIKTIKGDNVEVVLVDSKDSFHGMFWRFWASEEEETDVFLSRDCDSRFSEREVAAIKEWLSSNKDFHIMRDHPYHRVPFGATGLGILGGMWGIKSKSLPLKDMIIKFTHKKELGYGSDQTFLQEVYKLLEKDKITHDEFFENKPFPIAREYGRFIGDRIDVNDQPVGSDYKLVIK